MGEESPEKRFWELMRLSLDSLAALSFAGILTLAFLTPLTRAGIVSVCCFSYSLPSLAALRFASADSKFEQSKIAQNGIVLTAFVFSALLTLVGFGSLLWSLSHVAAVIFGFTCILALIFVELAVRE